MLKERYLTTSIFEDLREKMVFVGGPRQVGKTTLCRHFVAGLFRECAYFSWDNRTDRKDILASRWPAAAELLLFDEIHKYRSWKNLLKGEFDKLGSRYKFLVTGSAKLDLSRRGGDSLQGRYHYYRLHPFSVAETEKVAHPAQPFKELVFEERFFRESLETLFAYGGFPEPFIKQNQRQLRRWHNEKIERLFREDIQDLQVIRDLGNMKLLSDMLPDRAGSLLSLNALREDLEVSHRAAAHWLDVLESFYYHFRIYPFSGKKIRSLKKEPKLYLWDWSEVVAEPARFENLIASHLLKFVHFLTDHDGYKAELHFLRDVNKREVDFLVTIDRKAWFSVEVKLAEERLSPNILYFKERLNIPWAYQVVMKDSVDKLERGVRILSASKFLTGLI